MKFLTSMEANVYSSEQVAESVQRLNLLIDKQKRIKSFEKLCKGKKKGGFEESDLLDHQILKLNKNFISSFYLIKTMIRETSCDLDELTNFRS